MSDAPRPNHRHAIVKVVRCGERRGVWPQCSRRRGATSTSPSSPPRSRVAARRQGAVNDLSHRAIAFRRTPALATAAPPRHRSSAGRCGRSLAAPAPRAVARRHAPALATARSPPCDRSPAERQEQPLTARSVAAARPLARPLASARPLAGGALRAISMHDRSPPRARSRNRSSPPRDRSPRDRSPCVRSPPPHDAPPPLREVGATAPRAAPRCCARRPPAARAAARNCATTVTRRRAAERRVITRAPRSRPLPTAELHGAFIISASLRPRAAARSARLLRRHATTVLTCGRARRGYKWGHLGWGWRSPRPPRPDSECAAPSSTVLSITIWKIEVKEEASRPSQLPQEMFSDG